MTGLACTVALVACGNEDATTEDVSDDTSNSSQEEETTEADEQGEDINEDARAILEQSIEAMDDVKSFSMDMSMDQTIEVADEEPMETATKLKMDAIQEPLKFYQAIESPDPITGETYEIEQYFADGDIYTFDPMEDQWMKMSGELMGLNDLEDLDMSPEDQLETLIGFADEITVEDEGDRYALTINGSGDELKEIAQELASAEADPTMQAEMNQIFEGMNISKLDYVLYINKDTYFQEEMSMNLDMQMDADGESFTISQSSHGTFSQFNEIDEITIPSEAIENAVEMTEEDFGAIEGELDTEDDQ